MNEKAKQLEELASRPADPDLIHQAMLLTAGRVDMALRLSGLVANGASRRDVHGFIAECRETSAPVEPQGVVDSVCRAHGMSATTDSDRLLAIQIAMAHENTVILKEVLRQLSLRTGSLPQGTQAPSAVWPFALGTVFGIAIG